MGRTTESYRTERPPEHRAEYGPEHQAEHRAEHRAEPLDQLSDWQKKTAAESFLKNLEAQNPQLAYDLITVSQDPGHKPSWLTARRTDLELQYNDFQEAMLSLHPEHRDYVATETTSIILGDLRERTQHHAAQPASHILQGDAPPELRVNFDPDGYNSMMKHLQEDLGQRLSEATDALQHGLAGHDRYDFLNALTQLQGVHQALSALETGDRVNSQNFSDRRKQENYQSEHDSRSSALLDEYRNSIIADFPELATTETTAADLLTDPPLQEKFQWFSEAYELLPRDTHSLAHAIYDSAVQDAGSHSTKERMEATRHLRPLREGLIATLTSG